jgi:hypothetical protein
VAWPADRLAARLRLPARRPGRGAVLSQSEPRSWNGKDLRLYKGQDNMADLTQSVSPSDARLKY